MCECKQKAFIVAGLLVLRLLPISFPSFPYRNGCRAGRARETVLLGWDKLIKMNFSKVYVRNPFALVFSDFPIFNSELAMGVPINLI